MRFASGRLVEVLTKKKVPSGVWRCAEIVADNGDGYTVRYYRSPDIYKEGVDKVSAEVVRPCPPPLCDSVAWAVGDVAEVLDGGYWKVSVIEEDLGEDNYQIRVIGSLDEFRVEKSNIRMRQEWKENTWISLGKDSGNIEDLMMRICRKGLLQRQGGFKSVLPFAKSSFDSLKRSFADISSTDEGYSEGKQKRRALNKQVKFDAIHYDSYSFIGKADSHCNLKAIQSIHDDAMFLTKTSESNDCASVISSVSSCSVFDPLPDRALNHSSTSFSRDDESLCSDAESSNPWVDEKVNIFSEFRDAIKSHEIDLHSYRCFLEALYASGPLSWEQEILLTNIRMELFVSNDGTFDGVKEIKVYRRCCLEIQLALLFFRVSLSEVHLL
ncbi:hypothetical protein RND81_10G044400 [Saponaria officinalis]|uniref:ENT domain-containing protein n=1 Tax=Saponaria officinalis TaxID=3572 RepID=A0AAW1HXY3_SAPOF